MEVTQAEFARMCGVKPSSICEKVKNGTLIINSGKKLDTDNPVNRRYLTNKQTKLQINVQTQNLADLAASPIIQDFSILPSIPGANGLPASIPDTSTVANTSIPPTRTKQSKLVTPFVPSGNDYAITTGLSETMLNMTLLQLVTNYGGVAGIERFAKTLQTLTTANEKELRLQERRQKLVSKDFVTSRLFGYVDQLMNKLLDWPEGIIDTLIAKSLANKQEGRTELVNYMRDGLTRCICDAKQHIISELESLCEKYDPNRTELEEIKEAVEGLKNENQL